MPLNQPSLLQFEAERKSRDLIPHNESNSFFDVGDGRINIFTADNNPDDPKFDLFTDVGEINILHHREDPNKFKGGFPINGTPYRSFTIIKNTKLFVNHTLVIRGTTLDVHGTVEIGNSSIATYSGGVTTFHPSSILVITDRSSFITDNQSIVKIYGRIDIHISRIQALIDSPNIFIDSAAVFNVEGIDDPDRTFSLTDYEREMRERGFVNVNVQGERIFGDNRIGHIWRQGNPNEPSHVIGVNLQLGPIPLGDFRLPILGRPVRTQTNMQTISDLTIRRNTTLHITEEYNGHTYHRPELYLGIIIDNTRTPAHCTVQGTIIADGPRAMITIDRKATMRIEERGVVHLRNGAVMRCTHNRDEDGNDIPVLHIFGTLIIDDISQIVTFNEGNIVFGPEGKLEILNPATEEPRVLLSVPNGIKESHLYRLFEHRVQHIVYHIPPNTGIAIDQFFSQKSREFVFWFGDRRIEKAVHDGIVVWYSGAFVELYHKITSWITKDVDLFSIRWLFKGYGSFPKDHLQDIVNRLKFAGFGDILFKFVFEDEVIEITLSLNHIYMQHVMNNPLNNRYVLTTDNSGTLFLRNMIHHANVENLVHPRARTFSVPEKKVLEFILP